MTQCCLYSALQEALEEVLEKMFFAQPEGPAEAGRPFVDLVAAEVGFEGSPSGTLGLRIALPAARSMAADFLGEEAVSLAQVMEVICEMANMICGSVLSRVESQTTFRLSPPAAVIDVGPVVEEPGGSVSHGVMLPDGALCIHIRCEGSAS